MAPNPPWEDFVLHVTNPGEIRQVVVDTISTGVPEPQCQSGRGDEFAERQGCAVKGLSC